jgi:hypothetical protein
MIFTWSARRARRLQGSADLARYGRRLVVQTGTLRRQPRPSYESASSLHPETEPLVRRMGAAAYGSKEYPVWTTVRRKTAIAMCGGMNGKRRLGFLAAGFMGALDLGCGAGWSWGSGRRGERASVMCHRDHRAQTGEHFCRREAAGRLVTTMDCGCPRNSGFARLRRCDGRHGSGCGCGWRRCVGFRCAASRQYRMRPMRRCLT